MLGLYRDNENEHGKYYNGFIGIMEKEMETVGVRGLRFRGSGVED